MTLVLEQVASTLAPKSVIQEDAIMSLRSILCLGRLKQLQPVVQVKLYMAEV